MLRTAFILVAMTLWTLFMMLAGLPLSLLELRHGEVEATGAALNIVESLRERIKLVRAAL